MSSILHEKRLSLTTLAQREGVNVATVWRWTTKGARGAKLETVCVGGRRFTSDEAFARFASACSGESAPPPKPATNRQRQAAIARAEAELARVGI